METRRAAEEARWRIGVLRLDPRFSLSNVGYDENAFDSPQETNEVNDYHATLGAGLVGYLPVGNKSLLSAFVTPEYTWWRDASELREFSVSSGLAWLLDFNRANLAAYASDTKREQTLSSELEAPVRVSEESIDVELAIELSRRIVVFAEAQTTDTTYARETEQFVSDLDLNSLDRGADRQRYGFELRGSKLTLGVGFTETQVDFLVDVGRSNDGSGPLARLAYETDHLNLELNYEDLEIDFNDPALGRSEQQLGSGRLAVNLGGYTTVSLSANQSLSFAVFSATGIVEGRFAGAALTRAFNRFEASVFADSGNLNFVDPLAAPREDDLEAFGIIVSFDLTERLGLTARFSEESWDSTQPDFDRTTSRLALGIDLSRDLLPW